MDHANHPKTLPEVIDKTTFPIYGLINNPCDLTLCNHGIGISHLSNLISVTLNFMAPRSSNHVKKLTIISIDSAVELPKRENMSFDLRDPSDKVSIDGETRRLFRKYNVNGEQSYQTAIPIVWDEAVLITNVLFSAKVRYWKSLQLSLFLLKSEKSIIIGDGLGLSCDELRSILEGIQAINDRKDMLQKYQHEQEDNALIVAPTVD